MSKYIYLKSSKFGSYLINKSALKRNIFLFIMTFMVFFISLTLGDIKLSPLQVAKVLIGSGQEFDQLVVNSFRMPRILIALLAGASLAVAGGILQGMIRNPLASPEMIGITGGASAAVVMFLGLFSNENNSLTISIKWLPIAAFFGALVIALLVYYLSWKKGISPLRLILIGIGISALTHGLTTLLMLTGPIYRAGQANIWITGSVNGANWDDVWILLPWTLLFLIISLLSVRHLNIQELGEEVATGVGARVQLQRFWLLLLSTFLVGGAVAFAGGISFVGLIAPHMARRIVGASYGVLLLAAAFLGGILVMGADLIGRTIFLPLEVPAGVFTAAIGAPYFIYLLIKSKN